MIPGQLARRYRRQDEIGTPFCITIDYDTKEDQTVTIRDRDTMTQVRVPIDRVPWHDQRPNRRKRKFLHNLSMTCINHPLIRPESLESREYQLTVAMRALDANTLVVLPTGLGKTAVALIVAASRLYNEGGKVLMLAPTKPLVEQHLRYFEKLLVLPGNPDEKSHFVMFTGETPGEQRTDEWKRSTVIFATPQVIKNDILAGRYSLEDVTLMIIDECHRAVGNYAYVFLAEQYREQAKNPRILAMTASPGGQQEKVRDVCANIGIEQVETRSED